MFNETIEKAKTHFLEAVEEGDPDYPYFPRHVLGVEKWVKKILKDYPKADREIVLLSVWLHDIGRVIGDKNIDHALKSEAEARRFLSKMKVSPERIEKVTHCVRAHRCRDVQPESLEAKILAVADSASHMTEFAYIVMLEFVSKEEVIEKLDRDYRDAGLFPEVQKEITPIYKAWKELLKAYPVELDFQD